MSSTTTDRIVLQGVRATGFHGVLPEERREGQEFVVDVVLEVDLSPAGASDALADTVNYAEVAGDVVARITGPAFDLIEALAARIADDALRRPLVQAVEVVVHKPEAPVGHPFRDVQVQIRRERREPVVIALGSNLGDDLTVNLESAVLELQDTVDVDAVSPLYETDPVGGPEQPSYVNAVVVGHTSLPPRALLTELHRIEAENGRVRDVRWGPRTLDLDLVQYGDPEAGTDVVSEDPTLTLPHPRAHERAFVLVPWAQADPFAVIRVGGELRRVADLVEGLDTSSVRLLDDEEEDQTW